MSSRRLISGHGLRGIGHHREPVVCTRTFTLLFLRLRSADKFVGDLQHFEDKTQVRCLYYTD